MCHVRFLSLPLLCGCRCRHGERGGAQAPPRCAALSPVCCLRVWRSCGRQVLTCQNASSLQLLVVLPLLRRSCRSAAAPLSVLFFCTLSLPFPV